MAQDRTNLGGTVLRMDLATGVQGVTVQPGTDRLFSAEHGPDVDDEINLLRAGANYGWDPSQGGTVGSYDESVPMTDLTRFPDAVPAVWSSGGETAAPLRRGAHRRPAVGQPGGPARRGHPEGGEAAAHATRRAGRGGRGGAAPRARRDVRRLRAVRPGPGGALYVTTSNGDDDKVLRVAPA